MTGQVELTGRGQEIAQIRVADGIARRSAQQRQGFLASPRGGEGQAEVGLDALVVGGELEGGLERVFGFGEPPLQM